MGEEDCTDCGRRNLLYQLLFHKLIKYEGGHSSRVADTLGCQQITTSLYFSHFDCAQIASQVLDMLDMNMNTPNISRLTNIPQSIMDCFIARKLSEWVRLR